MGRMRWIAVVLSLVPFVVCALIYAPTLSGAFLSDDYAVLAALSDWSKEGRLLSALADKFHSGLDSPSFYYRPLSMASFGANFAWSGGDPLAWRLVNLTLHLTGGALVYVLVRMLAVAATGARSVTAPSVAAGVFLLFPTSPEAVAWVSGRYDLLALVFMLATLALFLRSSRWNDRWSAAGLLTAACALASKESAVLLPVLITAIAVARRAAQSGVGAGRVLLLGVRDAAPWIFLVAAYFGMRLAMFGSAIQVYAATSPLDALASGAWAGALTSAGTWIDATLPQPLARNIFLTATGALVALGALACWRLRAARAIWIAIALSALISVALLLPHVSALAANGEQGRLFYTTSSLLALLVGFGIAAALSHPVVQWRLMAMLLAAIVLIAAEVPLLRDTVAPWRAAGAQARLLAAALPATAGSIPDSGYGLVLVPDHLGSAPFGRNAQGGLMLPPTQSAALSSRLIVQTPADLPAWPADARHGLVDALRRYPLEQVWPAVAAGAATGTALPTDYFCWDDGLSRIVKLPLSQDAANGDWMDAWQSALAASACREVMMEVAKR